jgi:hypothetical protein
MSPELNAYLPLASLVVASVALVVSLLSAFPGLRTVLAVVRDGVLWLALFFVIGGIGFVAWQRIQSPQTVNPGPRTEALTSVEQTFSRP